MKKLLLFLAIFSTLNGSPLKLETLTVEQTTYNNPTLEKVSEFEVKIIHKDGIKRVKFNQLPQDIQDKLGVNPVAQQEVASKVKKLQEKIAIEKKTQKIEGKVMQVLSTGILLEVYPIYNGMVMTDRTPERVFIRGSIKAIDEHWIYLKVIPEDEPFAYKTTIGSMATVKSYKLVEVITSPQ